MAMYFKSAMMLSREISSGKYPNKPHSRRPLRSLCIIDLLPLLVVLLLPANSSNAFLYPKIPRAFTLRSPRGINPTASFGSKSTASIIPPATSLSLCRTLTDVKSVQTFVSTEHAMNMSMPGTALSFHGDGSDDHDKNSTSLPSRLFSRLPPFRIEDWNLLLYDIFLIVNLSVSISFWVIHRYDVSYIGRALNEGCLLSILWIVAGLWNGSFLYSSVDGHYPSSFVTNRMLDTPVNRTTDREIKQGGPVAAGLLALHTFINTINLRLLFALIVAVVEHRPALSSGTELLVPLELGYGLILMMLWRALHSSFVLR